MQAMKILATKKEHSEAERVSRLQRYDEMAEVKRQPGTIERNENHLGQASRNSDMDMC